MTPVELAGTPTIAAVPGIIVLGGSYGGLAVARSVGRHGIPVAYFSAQQSITRHSHYVTRNICWKGPGDPGALEALLGAAREHRMQGWVVFPGGDHEVQFVTRNYPVLSAAFSLVTQPWSELEQLNDKAQLYRLAEKLGIGFPLVYEDGSRRAPAVGDMRLPVVIKPASTEKSNPLTRAKAWQAATAADYERRHALATRYMGEGGFVVQELVPGDGSTQFSYAGLWAHGREIAGLTARRARTFPIDFGTSPFVETTEQPRVAEEAQKLLRAVNYHGLVEVEFKLDERDDRLKILDVNTRIWAWIGLGAAAGIDFPMLAATLAVGGEMPASLQPEYGATWIHPVGNALSVLQSLLRTGRPGYAAARSLFSESVSATFAADDPRPALAEMPVQLMRRLEALGRKRVDSAIAVADDAAPRTSAPK